MDVSAAMAALVVSMRSRVFLVVLTNLLLGALLLPTVRRILAGGAARQPAPDALAASQAALRASEARLGLALQASNVGLWDWDLATNRVYFSPEWKRQLGHEDDEVAGEYSEWERRLHPEDRDRTIAAVQAFIANPDVGYDLEFRLRHKDGGYRWIRASGMLLFDEGRPARMLGCHVDVTEQKTTEAALRASADEVAMALEAAAVGIWAWDCRTGTLTHRHATGPVSSLAPRTVDEFLALVHEGDRAMLEERMRVAPEAGRPYIVEFRIVPPDGTVRHVLARGQALRDGFGAVAGLRGVDLDVTEKKELEARIQQAQKMEAIGRLTGGVAHDFNNLLTAILGYVELLLDRFPDEGPERADLVEIRKAGLSAAALTRQLLVFSRHQALQPVVLDLNSVVTSVEGLLRRVIGEDIALSIALDPALPLVCADRSQMEQVLMNLAVNARDAMPGGGTLTIETGCALLARDAFGPGEPADEMRAVVLKVADTGCGMTDEVKARIFEPFFTTKEPGKGTGLGLATVFGVVKQGGGFIEVTSRESHGATFTIYLPETGACDAPTYARPAGLRVARHGREFVLVVDDDPGVRALAAKALERAGYRVQVADGADEALAVDAATPVDVLITDLVLRGADGRQLARALAERRPSLKVLYMSGYDGTSLLERKGLTPGPAFIAKPFLPHELARRVREALDGDDAMPL